MMQKTYRYAQFSMHSRKFWQAAMPTPTRLTALLLGTAGAIAIALANDCSQLKAIGQMPVGVKVIYVDPAVGTDGNHANTQAAPYRTISYALSEAQPGTIVQLAPGKYTYESGEVFPLMIKSGVILQGDEATKGTNVLIVGGGGIISPTFAGQNVTVWADNNSAIRGVTIANPNSRGTGVWIESTNAIVQNSTFTNNQREGVFITGTGVPKIENNTFTKNHGQGISIARAAQGEIVGNLFQDTGLGLAIDDTAAPVLTNNHIIQNLDGVVISGAAHPVLRQNLIENNKRDGVVAITNAQPNMGTSSSPGNNTIRNNGGCGLNNLTKISTLSVEGNSIENRCVSYSKN